MTARAFGRSTSSGSTFTVTTGRVDLGVLFGPLEAAVMEIVWSRPHPVSIADVHRQFSRDDAPPALTTVQTTLNRLVEKGVLRREKQRPEPMVYRAVLDRDTYLDRAARAALQTLHDLLGDTAMDQALDRYRDAPGG